MREKTRLYRIRKNRNMTERIAKNMAFDYMKNLVGYTMTKFSDQVGYWEAEYKSL